MIANRAPNPDAPCVADCVGIGAGDGDEPDVCVGDVGGVGIGVAVGAKIVV